MIYFPFKMKLEGNRDYFSPTAHLTNEEIEFK